MPYQVLNLLFISSPKRTTAKFSSPYPHKTLKDTNWGFVWGKIEFCPKQKHTNLTPADKHVFTLLVSPVWAGHLWMGSPREKWWINWVWTLPQHLFLIAYMRLTPTMWSFVGVKSSLNYTRVSSVGGIVWMDTGVTKDKIWPQIKKQNKTKNLKMPLSIPG